MSDDEPRCIYADDCGGQRCLWTEAEDCPMARWIVGASLDKRKDRESRRPDPNADSLAALHALFEARIHELLWGERPAGDSK